MLISTQFIRVFSTPPISIWFYFAHKSGARSDILGCVHAMLLQLWASYLKGPRFPSSLSSPGGEYVFFIMRRKTWALGVIHLAEVSLLQWEFG